MGESTTVLQTWDCDVLILGAGPGGTSAAITSQQAGLKTIVLERHRFPRYCPGETLHPGIEPLLQKLGVLDAFRLAGFLRFEGTWIHKAQSVQFDRYGGDLDAPWMGHQAWRSAFDHLLLNHAARLGVEVRQPCRALQPLYNQGRLVGADTVDGPIYARFVIDATGGSHWLARRLQLPFQYRSKQLIVHYGYSPTCRLSDADLPALFMSSHGWTWLARVRDALYHWARLSVDAQRVDRSPPEGLFETATAPIGRGADVTWRRVHAPAGPGYFIVGDAAWVLDPASSHGVLKAVMSGMLAGHAIQRTMAEPEYTEQFRSDYIDWHARWYEADVERLCDLYQEVGICVCA